MLLQPELLKSLSDILKHGGNSAVSRMQAGLQLKNAIYSKDQNVRAMHQQRWLQFPEDTRNYVKQNVSISFFSHCFRIHDCSATTLASFKNYGLFDF